MSLHDNLAALVDRLDAEFNSLRTQTLMTGTAATALSGHRVVTRLSTGLFGYATNTDISLAHHPLWVTAGAASSGAEVAVVTFGAVQEPSWSWTAGPVYLGTNGQLTQVAPTAASGAAFLAEVGCATSATYLFVCRQSSIALI